SRAIRDVVAQARRLAAIPRPIVLIGPTGVGKGVLARWMHSVSGRSGAFVTFPGGQVADTVMHSQLFGHVKGAFTDAKDASPGAFVRAAYGTFFLDELPHWSHAAQSTILRALGDREILPVGGQRDVPVTSAVVVGSTRPLDTLLADGTLLPDLWGRLCAFTITIPPLAERPADVAILAYHFLDLARRDFNFSRPFGFQPDALEYLMRAPWPANVRQLQGAVERMAVEAQEDDFVSLERVELVVPAANAAPRLSREDRRTLIAWAVERAKQDRRRPTSILPFHRNTIAYHRGARVHK
ncbi:MAG TPA: sigma 54-interacting transcriptional regulator, partial [Gemmatimonadales bacterium]|nr:sigma 54-interacting transcriptional regulator [Gemmatimonadales bacterium]